MSLNNMEKADVMAPLANFPPPISSTVPPMAEFIANSPVFKLSAFINMVNVDVCGVNLDKIYE